MYQKFETSDLHTSFIPICQIKWRRDGFCCRITRFNGELVQVSFDALGMTSDLQNPSRRVLTNGWRMVQPWSIHKNCLVTPSSTRKHRKPWRVSCKRGTETSTHLSSPKKNVKKRWSWYWCTKNAAKRCDHSIPPSTELLMNCFTKWHGDDSDLISSKLQTPISPHILVQYPSNPRSKLPVVSTTQLIGKKVMLYGCFQK